MQGFLFVFLLLWLSLLASKVEAQFITRTEADSLFEALYTSRPDTNRVKIWLHLGEYQVYKPGEFKADMDSAMTYAHQANELSRQLGYYKGEAKSLNLLGTIYKESRNFDQGIAYQQAAIQLFEQHKDISGSAGSYLLLAQVMRDKGDTQEARKVVQKAIDLYSKNGYLQETGHSYLEMGNTYANWGEELKEKIKFYTQALKIFRQADNKKSQADILKDLGDLYALQNNYGQSLVELHKALALYRTIHYQQLQGVYDLLGVVYGSLGDYQEALKYGLLAVKTAESLKDSSLQLCTIYNRVGITYRELKQYQKAYFYYKKSLQVAQKYNHIPSITYLTSNISNVLLYLDKPDEALKLLLTTAQKYPPQALPDRMRLLSRFLNTYTYMKQYTLAQQYCDQLIELSDNLDKNDSNLQFVFPPVIKFFLARKEFDKARKYLAKSAAFCEENRHIIGAYTTHLLWFQLDSMQANYPSAIRHFQLYKQFQDSLFSETKSRQLTAIEVQYETEQKEKDLQLKEQNIRALTKERHLQAKQIEQAGLIRNGFIGGAFLLLLLLGVIYNRYRLKQVTNLQLEAQQLELQSRNQALQVQQAQLEVQQQEIYQKNEHLSRLLAEKESLLMQKDTLIIEKEDLLKEKDGLLTEQERLLKEIHHRVKNNLQVVMSLLNSQAASLQDKAALSAIQESQNRVQAMALIHQKLYQSEGVARIDMPSYIQEVVAYLRDAYCIYQSIEFDLQVDEIELDVTQAVPLGLIINEAITNALKYAFPNGRAGKITLILQRLGRFKYQLAISDDGVGLPQGYTPSRSRSLGMTLLHGFSGQLGGDLHIISPPGLTISLMFEDEQLVSIYA